MQRLRFLFVIGVVVASALVVGGPPATASAQRALTCTTSRALFPNPLPTLYDKPRAYDYRVALNANRGDLWTGYAYEGSRGNRFAAISWRAGQKRATVLGRFTHPTGNYAGVVDMVGISSKHVIVAAVKHTKSDDYYGLAWYRGHQHRLAQRSSWVSVAPVGIADGGPIFGLVRSRFGGHNHYLIVRWAHRLASPRVVRDLGVHVTYPVVDSLGNLIYSTDQGVLRARLAGSGRYVTLAPSADNAGVGYPQVVGGSSVYAATGGGIERWDLNATLDGTVEGTAVIRDTSMQYRPTFAGRGGDLVFEGSHVRLRAASGRTAALGFDTLYSSAIDSSGAIARTLRSDGSVRLTRCR